VRKAIADGGDAETLQNFADWLLPIGDGTDTTTDVLQTIVLPDSVCLDEGCNLDALVDWVYPDLAANCHNAKWISRRAILTPLNETVNELNAKLGERFPGEALDCFSADAVKKGEDAHAAPTELLNSFNDIEGLPQHHLRLKKNMPIMLLRNLSPVVRASSSIACPCRYHCTRSHLCFGHCFRRRGSATEHGCWCSASSTAAFSWLPSRALASITVTQSSSRASSSTQRRISSPSMGRAANFPCVWPSP
jgi:hypothetical protein